MGQVPPASAAKSTIRAILESRKRRFTPRAPQVLRVSDEGVGSASEARNAGRFSAIPNRRLQRSKLRVPVSLIVTVRDDRQGFAHLLEAMADQVEPPDEIVVVDGGSKDGTLQELEDRQQDLPPVRVFVAPGANIAAGRNIAVREARYDWIACTDAGCRPIPGW